MKKLFLVFLCILGFCAGACTRSPQPESSGTHGVEVAGVYICPMHPEAGEFPHPGTCPICGMKLVKKGGR